ncbi:MAG: MFS transporter, partial [Candidatus Wildermuthbacteria bacterium]|nr:MFS transporter [Candidatus Wildermuthbacteria bacterium]
FSFLLFGFAASLPILFISRFLQGVFAGAVLPAARAYAADITAKQERVKVMGRIGASLSLGVIFGPAIGGIFAGVNLSFPFFAAAIVALVNFFFVLFFLPESLTQKTNGILRVKKLLFSNFSALWHGMQSSITPLLVLAFLWSFTFSNNQVAVPLLGLERFRLTPADIGILFAILGGVSAIVQFFFLEKIAKKIGQHKTIFFGMAVMAIGFAMMPFSPSTIFLYAATGIAGLGSAVTRPIITALISEETTMEQGATMGMANAYESLGRFIGPLAGGFLFGVLSFLPFVLAGTVVGIVLLSLLFFKKGFFAVRHRI